jgi:hypothetical protein
MKTIITLDKANVAYGFPQLDANGDLIIDHISATTISATTYYNLPTDVFVTGGTYTSGNAIFTNNTGGTFTVTGFAIGGGGGQLFYLNLSQTQGSNKLLSTTASTASEQTTGVTISSGVTATITSFQSQQLNTTLIPGGVWEFYLHSYKSVSSVSFDIFVDVYKISSGGTPTFLFTTDPESVNSNSPNPTMQLTDTYFSGCPLVVSDSIVAVVKATNTSDQSGTITFFTEGTNHYSYVISSIPTQQGLTCDTLSGCSIIQTIQTNITNKFDKSGGTISGNVTITGETTTIKIITSGMSVNGDISVTGISSLKGVTATGLTVNGNVTVTGTTTSGTISATTYQNLPAFLPLSGGTITGQVNVNSSSTVQKGIQVTVSNSGTSYGVYSYATNGTNAYGIYGVASQGEFDTITNGIGGYFAADNSNGGNPTNRYSVQLVDGTEGVGKVLTSVTSDGKANWDTPKTNGSNLYLFYNY